VFRCDIGARAAALAAAGEGEDAGKLPETERARLREQAVAWLRADLARCVELLENATAPQRGDLQELLRRWKQHRDLAGLRDAAALAKLSEAERKQCIQLWADVDALVKKYGEEPKK